MLKTHNELKEQVLNALKDLEEIDGYEFYEFNLIPTRDTVERNGSELPVVLSLSVVLKLKGENDPYIQVVNDKADPFAGETLQDKATRFKMTADSKGK